MYRSCRNLANTILVLWFQSTVARASVGAVTSPTEQSEHGIALHDELLRFADIPPVIRASRQVQPIDFSPGPIHIISDVLDDGQFATTRNIGAPGHNTPGRSFFGRVRMRF